MEISVEPAAPDNSDILKLVVRSGDTLDLLFRRNELSVSDLTAMLTLPEAKAQLARIRPGDEFAIRRDGNQIISLEHEVSDSRALRIERNDSDFVTRLIDLPIEIRTANAHGVIREHLYGAAKDAGLSDDFIDKIVKVFEYDIDFMLEVRTGDSFTVIYEEIWRDGVKLRNGKLIAAEYVNQGKTHRAARYVDATGHEDHYTPEGVSVQRPFLRNPIEFTRVSSSFNPNRRHPILNTIRAHRGVDLAAPSGTPIRAAGDGKIIALGTNGSYGRRVEIQHGGNITTLYAHMSKYGPYKVGDRVTRGNVIGYVGMSGGATGPHLHYEYRVGGVHKNPRTVELPEAQPIAEEYRRDFEAVTANLWRELDLHRGALLADNRN